MANIIPHECYNCKAIRVWKGIQTNDIIFQVCVFKVPFLTKIPTHLSPLSASTLEGHKKKKNWAKKERQETAFYHTGDRKDSEFVFNHLFLSIVCIGFYSLYVINTLFIIFM